MLCSTRPVTLLFLGFLFACDPQTEDTQPDTTAQAPGTAVVLVAAGYVAVDGPPDDPDAISEATTTTWNAQVYAGRLAEKLQVRGVDTTVVDWTDCKDLGCFHVPDAGSTADIAVFAGPTHYGVFPDQLRDLVPAIAELAPAPGVCSAISSFETAGQYAVDSFLEDLDDLGVATVEGAALSAEANQTEAAVEEALEALTGRLMGE